MRRIDREDVSAEGAERVVQIITPVPRGRHLERGDEALVIGGGRARDAAAGRFDLPVDLHELAYVIVRLIESYTYLDPITGERPDARRAEPILRMLLR